MASQRMKHEKIGTNILPILIPANEINGESKHGCTKSWTFATWSYDKGTATPLKSWNRIFTNGKNDCAKPSILEEDYRVHATEPVVKRNSTAFTAWFAFPFPLRLLGESMSAIFKMASGCGMVILPKMVVPPSPMDILWTYPTFHHGTCGSQSFNRVPQNINRADTINCAAF